MGKQLDKQIERIKSIPADYTFSEAQTLICSFGYEVRNKGRTSGSRIMFFRVADGKSILLHKPHPGDIMGKSAVRDLVKYLTEYGDLK